jgi:hypothetical protein
MAFLQESDQRDSGMKVSAANLQHPRIVPAPLALEELELELAAELVRADETTWIL